MTRPVYEPTESRQIRRQGFTGDQLLRRPAPQTGGTCGEWCRLGISTDQTVTPGEDAIMEWDIMCNQYPDFYTVVEAPPGTTSTTTAIDILQNGIYALVYELYIDSAPTNRGMWVEMNRVNWTTDAALQYHAIDTLAAFPVNSLAVTGGIVFRSGASYGPVFLTAVNAGDADANIVILGDDLNITYMEVLRLCDEEFVGNPYNFVTT